jgi:23S rRNA pseudouridine1911/1915/1917 synthase
MARKRTNGPSKPATDPLIGPGGKVSKSALYRAAQAGKVSKSDSATKESAKAIPPAAAGSAAGDAKTAREKVLDDESPIAQAPVIDAEVEDDEPPPQRVVFTMSHDLDKRLDKYLVDRITFMSRAKLQQLIEDGGVMVNGRAAKSSTKLRIRDVVEVMIPPPPSEHVPAQDIPLAILYEDEHIVVVNKTPDIIVHPARSHLSGTMINALTHHFQKNSSGALSSVGKEFARPGVVHRLDKQTSGCIVFAKSEQAHWQLGMQFEKRTVDKRYLAFVHGHVEPRIDVIDLPLGPHPSREKGHREKQVVRHDHLGKPAVTIARVLGHYQLGHVGADEKFGRSADSPRVSLVEVELKTGRTHQIRVHMSHMGWPLLADDMYNGRVLPQVGRVALHAALLSFRHPITNQAMRFQAPLPADLRSLLEFLRKQPGASEYRDVPGSVLSFEKM